LRKLSQSGKLTAEVFANMLLQATSLDERFKLLNPTIDTLEQKTGDAFDRFLAKIGEATGLTALYKRSLESLSEFFDRQAGLYDPEELLALKKFEQAQAEVEKSIERIRDDLIIAQSMMDEGSESMLMEQLEKELAMLDKIIQAKVDSNRETAKNVPLLKKIDPRIKAISDSLDKMAEKYSDVSMISKLVENSFTTFGNVATRELTSVIFEAKRLDVALGNIARETLKAIIQGFIEMAIVAPIVRFLVDQFKELLGITKKDNDEQAKKNKLLEREIKLRAILALFGLGGFANGGEVGYANGGSIGYGGARALGGPVAGANAYLVGERGPELFVPNSAGTIVPNERLGSSMGDTNINFNISATDASSFDSMLVQRRGLITNIINDALSRQGRRFA
jgi:tetratricopeptide (TPR) repeat protein